MQEGQKKNAEKEMIKRRRLRWKKRSARTIRRMRERGKKNNDGCKGIESPFAGVSATVAIFPVNWTERRSKGSGDLFVLRS